jgi:endonuclease YncB( thermonuclease family)
MQAAPPFDVVTVPFAGTVHRALIYRVHDGDTCWPVVDLGFGVAHANPEKGIRLVGPNAKGFNTPELNASDPAIRQAAQRARDRVIQLVQGKYVYVESWPPTTDDKYGRWLMAIYVVLDPSLGITPADIVSVTVAGGWVQCLDLASQLVAEGLGVWQNF